ncbi:unnamed protein product [Rotaria sp. Silwood2]|nr:unnamed protein product [Rotaria sp. Silwood2]CAF2806521.1 unnamed protein product [Rotaria sp. Silwood2]CAF3059269.1 unnamed protein product [Rotaria sp. Silwood2]CAF3190053.1 unnamed protein product [Rotaria sp. Silwood2]CAF4082970.1 unnamed protein product [Rotaria sp. Silwood2]
MSIKYLKYFIEISPIQTIACYTCIDCGDPFDVRASNASQSLPKLTVYMAYAPTRYVVKECVQSCNESGYLFGGSSLQVNCCTSSFCNNALGLYTLRNIFFIISTLFILFFTGNIK